LVRQIREVPEKENETLPLRQTNKLRKQTDRSLRPTGSQINDLRKFAKRCSTRRAPPRHAGSVDDASPDPAFQRAATFEAVKLAERTGETFLNSILPVLDAAGNRLGHPNEPVIVPVIEHRH